ncbi:MAG: putative OB-fold protein [Candidatus Aldehydirespiratoraceae bacterium]|jgi:uncharacterized OB-fold protein
MVVIPIAEGLFEEVDGLAALIGGRCQECDTVSFPLAPGCPRCSSANVASMPLARRGTLWTWTSQEFRPITPPYTGPGDASDFEPYFVGYVELPGEVRVEARLSGFDGRTPTIGEEVELVILPFNETIEGDQVVSYAFTPVAEGAST